MRHPNFVGSVSRVAVLAGLIVALLADGCKSSAASDDGAAPSGGGGTGGQSPVDCGAISLLPPIVQVFDGVTGLAICDPTFAVVGWPDGGGTAPVSVGATSCAGPISGCPVPVDSGVPWCAFALLGLTNTSAGASYTLEVSRTGYQSATVPDVIPGVGGCVPPIPASHHSVSLNPVAANP